MMRTGITWISPYHILAEQVNSEYEPTFVANKCLDLQVAVPGQSLVNSSYGTRNFPDVPSFFSIEHETVL
jgi:hypothetical protein